jgi:hypothetical protein
MDAVESIGKSKEKYKSISIIIKPVGIWRGYFRRLIPQSHSPYLLTARLFQSVLWGACISITMIMMNRGCPRFILCTFWF